MPQHLSLSGWLMAAILTGATSLGACNRTSPKEAVTETPAKPEVPGPDLMSISDSNAVAVLTEYGRQYPAREVLLQTRHGNMRIRLYDDTPLHTANFLLLSRKGVFDETVFNRVVKGFAIQGGTSDFRTIRMRDFHLPPEIRPNHYNKRGALGMARYDEKENPGRLSSNNDFYIVQGQKLTPAQAQATAGRQLTPEQLKTYATQGGTPSLDGQYTVFGEVVEGFEVIDKIANEPVGTDSWPTNDVHIKIKVLD
ncbi:peptidylprolyl isomerase [Hymenobacter tenuis]